MNNLFSIASTAILAQNMIMVLMLCDGRFFSVVKTPERGFIYGLLVTCACTLASALSWPVWKLVLLPYKLSFLSPLCFIFIIALLEVAAEAVLSSFAPKFKKTLGGLLPASAINCAVLGLVFMNVQYASRSFAGAVLYGFFAGLGFMLSLFAASSALERVRYSNPPPVFRGAPIAFITASLISLGFMGFSGFIIPHEWIF